MIWVGARVRVGVDVTDRVPIHRVAAVVHFKVVCLPIVCKGVGIRSVMVEAAGARTARLGSQISVPGVCGAMTSPKVCMCVNG
jgi:hypothetical protein